MREGGWGGYALVNKVCIISQETFYRTKKHKGEGGGGVCKEQLYTVGGSSCGKYPAPSPWACCMGNIFTRCGPGSLGSQMASVPCSFRPARKSTLQPAPPSRNSAQMFIPPSESSPGAARHRELRQTMSASRSCRTRAPRQWTATS
jgi:hypothetical protein